MGQVTLRPSSGLGYLKIMIVIADLMFLALPLLIASVHVGAAIVAIIAVFSFVTIAAFTFFGWLGLQMRVEVEPDALYIYYFLPKPGVIPREVIADVQVGTTRNGYYAPRLVMTNGQTRLVPLLTERTKTGAEGQAAQLRLALRDVTPAA